MLPRLVPRLGPRRLRGIAPASGSQPEMSIVTRRHSLVKARNGRRPAPPRTPFSRLVSVEGHERRSEETAGAHA